MRVSHFNIKSTEIFTVEEACKWMSNSLKKPVGRNSLFAFMREHKWTYYNKGKNLPYQTAINQKLLLIERTIFKKEEDKQNYFRIYITSKGLIKLHKLITSVSLDDPVYQPELFKE